MTHPLKKLVIPAAALAALAVAAPASATITSFASYTTNSNGSFVVSDSGNLVKISEKEVVDFNFLNTSLAPYVKGLDANLVLTASAPKSSYSAVGGLFAYQTALSGSFKFTSVSSFKVGNVTYAAGTTLLTVNFAGATLSGLIGSSTGGFQDDTVIGGTITYSSTFLSFTNSVARDFSVSLSAITPPLSGSTTLRPFKGTPTGSFSADPVPTVIVPVPVPEPTTWALMLVGFGAIGLGLRGATRREELTA